MPSGRDLADNMAGGLVGGADRDAEPIGQAQPRHVGDLRRQRAPRCLGDVGGDGRSVSHDSISFEPYA